MPRPSEKTALRLTAVALCILLSAAGTAAFRLYELWCDLPDVNALLEQAAVRREAMPRTLSLAFLALEDTAFLRRENGENSPIVRHLARWLLRSGEKDADYLLKRSLLAWKLEYNLSRDDILTLYLNHIYLGGHSVGVNSAARFYFGINTAALSTGQCALLAGLARCPASCSLYAIRPGQNSPNGGTGCSAPSGLDYVPRIRSSRNRAHDAFGLPNRRMADSRKAGIRPAIPVRIL